MRAFLSLLPACGQTFNVLLPTVLFSLTATASLASDREALAAQIINSGSYEWEDERFTVEIEDCRLTRELFEPDDVGDWEFSKSISFRMDQVIFTNSHQGGKRLFTELNRGSADQPEMVGIATVRMRKGTVATREQSIRQKTLAETTPSPRGDGASFVFRDDREFLILIEGPEAVSRTHQFTQGIKLYAERYCNFMS